MVSAESVPFPKGPPHNILALPDSCSQFRYYLQTLGPNVGVMYRHGHVCSIFAELAAGIPR